MKISHIKIENYRSIKFIDIDLPQYCAFVGQNNVGKSNILKAIQSVLGRDWVGPNNFTDDDLYQNNTDLDMLIEITFDPYIEYKKLKNDENYVKINKLSFKLTKYKKGENAGERRLEQHCFDIANRQPSVMVNYPKKGERPKFEPIIGIPQEIKENIPMIYINTNRSLEYQLPCSKYSLLRQLFLDINEDLNNPENTILYKDSKGSEVIEPRINRFKSLLEEALNLLKTDEFNKLEKSIKQNALIQLGFNPETDSDKLNLFFSTFTSFEFYKSLDLVLDDNSFPISATKLGEGVQNIIVLAIIKAFEERKKTGAIFLIEEPEMFLHPQKQRFLNQTLENISKNNQVIITTHSANFVSISNYQNVLLVYKENNGTQIRKSDLETSKYLYEKYSREFDAERNEMFFAKKVLFVEGAADKLAFIEYAKRLSIDLNAIDVTIVEVSGKRNLKPFIELAKSFKIPVGVVYDKDSTEYKDRRGDEITYNSELNAFESVPDKIKIWSLEKNYEDFLERNVGTTIYAKVKQKYSEYAKAIQTKLIAADAEIIIPGEIKTIISWCSSI